MLEGEREKLTALPGNLTLAAPITAVPAVRDVTFIVENFLRGRVNAYNSAELIASDALGRRR